ncbi:hypothetical protein PD280_05585 [Virgibacillus salarius]|uniref:hypothetical protein n=1 Tax=Virgibacillus salarius TaxID=447199 RepID=UPI002491A744|nr:hypothetical protein [Virgibacillus salarius]WBX81205.1 hypothetical protein PD280_05585 [Virgibacillus salarius]
MKMNQEWKKLNSDIHSGMHIQGSGINKRMLSKESLALEPLVLYTFVKQTAN